MLKVIKPLLVSVVALSLGMDASSTAAFGAGFRGGGQGRVVAAHGFGGSRGFGGMRGFGGGGPSRFVAAHGFGGPRGFGGMGGAAVCWAECAGSVECAPSARRAGSEPGAGSVELGPSAGHRALLERAASVEFVA